MSPQTQQQIEFEISGQRVQLDIVEFKPLIVDALAETFHPDINGVAGNDGVTGFRTLVFPKIPYPYFTGECKIRLLERYSMADPVLLWSMYKQPNQTILRKIYAEYGIEEIDVLRRVFFNGYRKSLLMRRSRDDGHWSPINRWLKPQSSPFERTMCLI